MPELRAVLFDLDDTLIDHTWASESALRAWIPTFGVAESEVAGLIDVWARLELVHWPAWRSGEITFEEQRRRRARDFMVALGRPAGEHELDAIYAGYLDRYVANWTAFPDAAPVLRRARQRGLRVGVLTNGNQVQQVAKLTATGLIDLCGPVFASSELPLGKPHPEAYVEACRRLGVEPSEALMVGDNHELDVTAAQAAGLAATHLHRTPPCECGSPCITTLADLALP